MISNPYHVPAVHGPYESFDPGGVVPRHPDELPETPG